MGQVFAYVSQQKIITLEKLSTSIFFTKQNNICSAHKNTFWENDDSTYGR
jgi:hypothetical protein